MDDNQDTSSVVDRTRLVEAGALVVGTYFLDRTAVFALGEEALLFVAAEGETRRVEVHGGGILSVASDGARIVTGGDDGKVISTDAKGARRTIFVDHKGRWIDSVATAPDGATAWSAGKTVFMQADMNEPKSLDLPSSAGGLAFAPKGGGVAVAHYGGVSLWFPNLQHKPEILQWKGSHHNVAYSPDGKFLVASMLEPMLRGWRLADTKHMRMSGYSTRVRSLGWTADGKWLATAGSEQLVMWPFQSREGPMGKRPRMFGTSAARVNVVACHPKQEVVACGYADGWILLVRVDHCAEEVVRKADGTPVSSMAWDESGKSLAFGTEGGLAGVIDLASFVV